MDFTDILSRTPLASYMPPKMLQQMVQLTEPVLLQSGQYLYRENDSPDYFYVVISGRLRVMNGSALLGHLGFGDLAGEAGVISGEPRIANVRAVRDSLVLRLPRQDFLDFLNGNAAASMALTQRIIARSRQSQRSRELAASQGQSIFTLFPASDQVPVMALAETLARRFGGWPQVRIITARHCDATFGDGEAQTPYDAGERSVRLMNWCAEMERRHRYVIYVADDDDSPWALRCLRQADRVLAMVEADMPPKVPKAMARWREGAQPLARVELVILRPEGDPSPHTLGWQHATGAKTHYYLHPDDSRDLNAFARQITGRGIGLVLGGGGARGFAHIGLLRAMEQLQIPIDVVGGTSMGAFVSALAACEFDNVEIAQIARETFVENNYLNDYTLPRVSLIKAQRFLTRLRSIFGTRHIEELRRSYYCISTNLTTGATVVHNQGPLAEWVGTSMAVPGVAPPIAWEGDLLCDGGVVDNLPTAEMQTLERGTIIACSVSSAGDLRAPGLGVGRPDPMALLAARNPTDAFVAPQLMEILLRTATLASDTTLQQAAIERADIYLRMPVDGYGMFDWRRMDELIEMGYNQTMRTLEPLRDQLLAAVN